MALDRLHRMLGAGERHSLQVMATLHRHYAAMLRLDGADVGRRTAGGGAARPEGRRPSRPARRSSRRAGSGTTKVVQAIALLAQADLDLRGLKDWPPELVLEVLVARLAFLGRR